MGNATGANFWWSGGGFTLMDPKLGVIGKLRSGFKSRRDPAGREYRDADAGGGKGDHEMK